MHKVADDPYKAMTSLNLDIDTDLAQRSAARLLITGSTQNEVESIARGIHAASVRAAFPFVQIQARDLPRKPWTRRSTCAHLLDARPAAAY